MIAPIRFSLFALIAAFLLALPTPARADSGLTSSGVSTAAPICFGNIVYNAFTDRARVVQISLLFVAAGYFFLRNSSK